MKTELKIEQFDNGITLREESDSYDPISYVCLNDDIEKEIGKLVWEDVLAIMDSNLVNKVVITVQTEPDDNN